MEFKFDVEEYMKKFRVLYPTSLFPPDFKMLQQFRCPLCSCKLVWKKDRSLAFCKSKKGDKFVITAKAFEKLIHR